MFNYLYNFLINALSTLIITSIAIPANAANYTASNETELRNAIDAANADPDATATVTLTANIPLASTTAFPALTKTLTINTNGFTLSGFNQNVGQTPGGTFTIPNGDMIISGNGLIRGGDGFPVAGDVSLGVGGAGVTMGGGTLTNQGAVLGGTGASKTSGATGGGANGGAGVSLTDTNLNNTGTIIGGTGGDNSSGIGPAGIGGTGAALTGGTHTNSGTIRGGEGGVLTSNNSQPGGTGLNLNDAVLTNQTSGIIEGGPTIIAGSSGNGMFMRDSSTLYNFGIVRGGAANFDTNTFGARVGITVTTGSPITNAIINNHGVIEGGFGGPAIIVVPFGGTNNLTIVNSGTISAGQNETFAIQYGTQVGAVNILEIQAGSAITGIVNTRPAVNVNDIFRLGGDTDSTFDVSTIGSAAQYRGFDTFQKTGNSTWTLIGLGTTATPWTVSSGTLALTPTSSLTAGSNITIESGGTFGGYGSVTGNVSNAGTLAAANAISTFTGNGSGTLTITGNYTQSAGGVFQTAASSDTDFGKLTVSGVATMAAGTGIHVNATSGNSLAIGNTLASVISAGSLSASTFTVTDNSFLFNFTALVNGNALDLITEKGTSVLDSVIATSFKPGIGAAGVLDGFVNGGATGTDRDNIVTAFGQLPTEREVSNAVAQTLPSFTGGMGQIALNTLHDTNRVIQARQESNRGLSSGEGFLGDRKLWLKPLGSWARQGSRNGVSGYEADTYGFVGGADGEVNENTRIGVALSYMRSDVEGRSSSSGNSADINAYTAIVYGSHTLESIENAEINWQADLGTNDNNTHRDINFGGLNRVAKADYDSVTAHIGAGFGRNFAINDKTMFAPAFRADYYWIRDESYTERGAGVLNLDVDSNATDQLILMAEGRISHALTNKAKLLANFGVGYDVLNGENSITASFVGGGAAFTTRGLDPSPWLARGGLGLAVNATETVEISARYDVEARSDFLNQTASAKLRWAF